MDAKGIPNEQLLEALQWRYAVKKFDSARRVSEADWKALEASLVLAPSSFGLQPYKFVVVTDQSKKDELREHAWHQSQVSDASHLVVIAAKNDLTEQDVERLIDRIAEVRHVPRESLKEYEGMIKNFQKMAESGGFAKVWTAKQAYIALGFLLAAAALRGIDACPMEGFAPDEFSRILGLDKEGYSAVVLCTVGYRAVDDAYATLPKVRLPQEWLVQHI